ncbi:hypothetical protein HZB60_04030 [candidate division KSB1 bacterium]|nr:hypothetical protein [candidate division KSB1 bacterium]
MTLKKGAPANQLSLLDGDFFFAIPKKPDAANDFRDLDYEVARALGDILCEAPLDRKELAAKVSAVLDRHISIHMLANYSSPAAEDHRLPFSVALALDVVLQKPAMLDFYAKRLGGIALMGEDALLAELGLLEKQEMKLRARKKLVQTLLKNGK